MLLLLRFWFGFIDNHLRPAVMLNDGFVVPQVLRVELVAGQILPAGILECVFDAVDHGLDRALFLAAHGASFRLAYFSSKRSRRSSTVSRWRFIAGDGSMKQERLIFGAVNFRRNGSPHVEQLELITSPGAWENSVT
jgi:hypothetical protein